jgi:hypothetical protein
MDRAGLETAVGQGVLDEACDESFILHDQNTNGITHFQISSATEPGRLACGSAPVRSPAEERPPASASQAT